MKKNKLPMNLPNRLTMVRIVMIPVYLFLLTGNNWCRFAAGLVFAAASITDYFDGRIARERNLITDFGKFMDPIADKLLVMSALVMLVEQRRMPAWVCILMFSREFIVSGFRLVASGKGKVIAAGIWGKLKTITQMIYVPMALLLIPIKALDPAVHPVWQVLTDIMMYISLALTLWSGFWYIWNNREYIKDM